jgi:hypothetical protein
VYNNGGTVTIQNSTFSTNSATGAGGGVYNNGGTVTIQNSTFSANSAPSGYGGGVSNSGTLTIQNSTFSANSASVNGGAVYVASGTFNLGSSIVAGNSASSGGPDISGAVNSLGHNLVGDGTGATGLTGTGDQVGTSASPINPLLNALAYNGGPTQTMSLQASSPTISKGNCSLSSPAVPVSTDQRGVSRKTPCDVGAYETRNDTIGIFRPSVKTFYLRLHNSTGNADITVGFGPGTKPYPVVGDWTGAGYDTVGDVDQNNGLFSLCNANVTATCANSSNVTQLVLGNANDTPLSGKWTASTTHFGVGVFRPSNGLIYLKNNLTTGFAEYTMVLGIPGDVGLAGDWTGNGYDSPGVYRPSNSNFYLTNKVCNCNVFADIQFAYGVGGDAPVMGDWTGLGHDGAGLFRQSNGYTYLKNALTTGFADITFTYGVAGDVPVAGHWQLVYPPVPNTGNVLVTPTASGMGD